MNKLKLSAFLMFFVVALQAQSIIELKFNDKIDSQFCLLGYQFFDNSYLVDSVLVTYGSAVFTLPQNARTGMYFLFLRQQSLSNVSARNVAPANFIFNGQSILQFQSVATALSDSLKLQPGVKDQENALLFDLYAYVQKEQNAAQAIREMMPIFQRTGDSDLVAAKQEALLQHQKNISRYTRSKQMEHPQTYFGRTLNASLLPEVPETIPARLPNGQFNKSYQQYLVQHYWDNFDFTDSTLMMSDILPRRLTSYFNGFVDRDMDSLTQACAKVMELAKQRPKTKQLVQRWLITSFESQQAVFGDTLMAFMFDRYMKTATQAGLDTFTWERVKYKVNMFRPTIPGKIAPDIELPDISGQMRKLSQEKNNYTLLYFFNPNCGQCMKITPQVRDLLQPYYAKGLGVYAVTNEPLTADWQKYISVQALSAQWTCVIDTAQPGKYEDVYAINQLPNIFLLDQEKRIVLKKLTFEELQEFLPRLFGE